MVPWHVPLFVTSDCLCHVIHHGTSNTERITAFDDFVHATAVAVGYVLKHGRVNHAVAHGLHVAYLRMRYVVNRGVVHGVSIHHPDST